MGLPSMISEDQSAKAELWAKKRSVLGVAGDLLLASGLRLVTVLRYLLVRILPYTDLLTSFFVRSLGSL